MAKTLYPTAKKKFLDADIDMLVDDIRVVALRGYDFNAAHEFLADVLAESGTVEVCRTAALAGKTTTGGSFKANDQTVAGVDNGLIEEIVVFKHTGNNATAPVIYHTDEKQDGNPIGLTTNGSDVLFDFHTDGLFDL